MSKIHKFLSYMLIWTQILSCICFADQNSRTGKKEFLSPKISISKDSLQKSINAYSKAKVENAFFATVENINNIGQSNLERELNLKELLVALAMVFGGKRLKDIDSHFANRNYLLEESGIKGKPMFLKRTVRAVTRFLFLKNKYESSDPIKDLNDHEQKEFLKKIKMAMSNVINRFDEPERKLNSQDVYGTDIDPMGIKSGRQLCPMTGSVQFSQGVFSSI